MDVQSHTNVLLNIDIKKFAREPTADLTQYLSLVHFCNI